MGNFFEDARSNIENLATSAGSGADLSDPLGLGKNSGGLLGQLFGANRAAVGFSTRIAGQDFMSHANVASQDLGRMVSAYNGLTGYRTAAEDRQAAQMAGDAEAQARASAFNSGVKDKTLDPQTQSELAAMYDSGATSDQIASFLNNARAGKGIYAVRRVNSLRQTQLQDRPGRMQTLSLNRPNKSVLGGGL